MSGQARQGNYTGKFSDVFRMFFRSGKQPKINRQTSEKQPKNIRDPKNIRKTSEKHPNQKRDPKKIRKRSENHPKNIRKTILLVEWLRKSIHGTGTGQERGLPQKIATTGLFSRHICADTPFGCSNKTTTSTSASSPHDQHCSPSFPATHGFVFLVLLVGLKTTKQSA